MQLQIVGILTPSLTCREQGALPVCLRGHHQPSAVSLPVECREGALCVCGDTTSANSSAVSSRSVSVSSSPFYNQSINQSVNQSTSQSVNQSTFQSIIGLVHQNKKYLNPVYLQVNIYMKSIKESRSHLKREPAPILLLLLLLHPVNKGDVGVEPYSLYYLLKRKHSRV